MNIQIDLEDEHLLVRRAWFLSNGYLASSNGGILTYFHREIAQASSVEVVDHINGDILDNRRCNLRVCTQAENTYNKHKTINKKTSKYKGVSYRKSHKAFQATITKHGIQEHLGYFKDEVQAALAYDAAAVRVFGIFAKINGIKLEELK